VKLSVAAAAAATSIRFSFFIICPFFVCGGGRRLLFVGGLAAIFARTGRAAEARQMLEDFARNHPDQRPVIEMFEGSIRFSIPPAKPPD